MHRCFGQTWLWLHKCRDCGPTAALTRRIPTAVYVHDHDYYCFRRHKYLPFKRINCPLPCGLYCLPCGLTAARQARWRDFRRNLSFVRQADLVLAGSDYMLGNLVANGFPPNRLRKLSPLVDCRSTASAEPDSRPGEILYVGQVIRGKGVDLLLQAVAQLSCPWHLTVVGEGGDLDFCRRLADHLGIADRVDFPAYVTPDASTGKLRSWPSIPLADPLADRARRPMARAYPSSPLTRRRPRMAPPRTQRHPRHRQRHHSFCARPGIPADRPSDGSPPRPARRC